VNLVRYFHTLRYLRPIQIYGRAWQRFHRPQADFSPPPALRPPRGVWTPAPPRQPKMLAPRRFRFLNEERELSWPSGWSDPTIHRLWLFNLHYFEDLVSSEAPLREHWHQDLIIQWIADNSGSFAGPAWIPYVTSLRIINWIKWSLAGGRLPEAAIASLAMQTRYLRQRLEIHLLGNHLLVNAKAMVFAGLFFQGDEADRWLETGLRILSRQLPEQILPDGGHYELSPMYHALVLEDLLDLMNLFRVFPNTIPPRYAHLPALVEMQSQAMRRWLAAMTLPDGDVALFNDAAQDIAPRPSELEAYAARLGQAPMSVPGQDIIHLAASGYVRLQTGPAVAILDVGEIGPAFIPGHGHADVLTFELALFGRRLVVNSGTSVYYGNDAQRLRERSTPAHNTVTVDDQDSSEVWNNFRVARRAHPRDLVISEESDGSLVVTCAHDGYRRLAGKILHRRRWRLRPDRLDILDQLSAPPRSAIARFHLHPDIQLEASRANRVDVRASGHRLVWSVEGAESDVEQSTYHPQFGLSIPNLCLVARMRGLEAACEFVWDADGLSRG
jgi:uncharacterized heparinase superfamily protein